MTQNQFSPFHNYHIRFRTFKGFEFSGVIVIPADYKADKSQTIYTFIPTSHLLEWKEAEKEKDEQKMTDLQGEIDIETIEWAKRLN